MLDLVGLPGGLTTDDFSFKTGNTNTPSTWLDAPALPTITIRSLGGFDRVELTWADNAIQKTWLEVMVKANANTGFAQGVNVPAGYGYVFFFGNALGDTGLGDTATVALVNATDEIEAREHQLFVGATVTNVYDFDRSGGVNATDQLIVRSNGTIIANGLRYLNFSAGALAPVEEPQASPAAAPSVAIDGGVEWVGLSNATASQAATAGSSWSGNGLTQQPASLRPHRLDSLSCWQARMTATSRMTPATRAAATNWTTTCSTNWPWPAAEASQPGGDSKPHAE